MRMTILNPEMLETVVMDICNEFNKHHRLNILYEKAKKPKTMAQMGFVFAALISQITDFFRSSGFIIDEEDVKYKLYEDVSKIVPEMVVDKQLFGGKPRVRRISEMDRELMSKFINGIFEVISQDPLYSGLKLTPDTYYNWVYHLDKDQIRYARSLKFPELDPDYLEFVRDKPCIICGIQHRSEAHHLKDNRLGGISQKSPDWTALPLCHHCHMAVAHGTGFKEALNWIPIALDDFARICYMRYMSKMN